MRKSILLPLLVAACSGDAGGDTYRVVPDFLANATPLACEPADVGDVAVEQLRTASDTSFLVLDAAQRRVTEFGDDLRPLWSLEYPEHGPAGVQRPAGAVLVGDTAVAILARDGLRLVVLGRDGRLRAARHLEFVPAAVATSGDEILVSAVPMGPNPGSLLFRVGDETLVPVPVPPRPYDDMLIGAIGNQTVMDGLPDGGALILHQFFAPRGFRLGGDGSVVPLAVPTPDATAANIDYVPQPPLDREQYDEMLVPAIAVSVDRRDREVYLLTRSGRETAAGAERALIRTDDRLGFLAGFTLDAHAIHLAILPRRRTAVVVDDLDRFYLCPIDADTRAE